MRVNADDNFHVLINYDKITSNYLQIFGSYNKLAEEIEIKHCTQESRMFIERLNPLCWEKSMQKQIRKHMALVMVEYT